MKRLAFVFFVIGVLISFGYAHTASAEGSFNSSTVKDAGWDKLTPDQQADVLKQITNNSNMQGTIEAHTTKVETVNKWVEVGAGLGDALVILVQKLGVTVNDFLKTPAGLLSAAMIFWHIMGDSLVHLFFGFAFIAVAIPAWIYSFRRSMIKEMTRERSGFFKWKTTVKYCDMSDGDIQFLRWMHFFALIVIFGFGLWIA